MGVDFLKLSNRYIVSDKFSLPAAGNCYQPIVTSSASSDSGEWLGTHVLLPHIRARQDILPEGYWLMLSAKEPDTKSALGPANSSLVGHVGCAAKKRHPFDTLPALVKMSRGLLDTLDGRYQQQACGPLWGIP